MAGRSKIRYLDYQISPVKGKCPNITNHAACVRYCYMANFLKRFEHSKKHPMDPTIRFDEKELLWTPKEPGLIGVCFNLDLFHPDLGHDDWVALIVEHARQHPEHTWVFLTKFPEEYANYNFSENCWLGTTVDGLKHTKDNVKKLLSLNPHYKKWVSVEPLKTKVDPNNITHCFFLGSFQSGINGSMKIVDWIAIGQDTSPGAKRIPKAWIDTIVLQAKEMGIPIWMKDSLSWMDYMIKERPPMQKQILYEDEFPNGPWTKKVNQMNLSHRPKKLTNTEFSEAVRTIKSLFP